MFAALPRPLATMIVHQKIILELTLNSSDVMNKTKKESTPKDQHRQHAVQKCCDSEMPTEKTELEWEKCRFAPSHIDISVDIYSNALKFWERT